MSPTSEGSDFPKLALDCSNWRTWIEKAEDYLRERKHYRAGDIITDTWWNGEGGQDPALEYRALPTRTEDEKKFKIIHMQAFAFLRRQLSEALFNKTLELEYKTVPDLLRFLRLQWNDGSVIDRTRLRDEMEDIKLAQFATFSEYESAFTNLCTTLESNGISTYSKDEEKLYKLIKGLDETWTIPIEMMLANEKNYKEAVAYFQKVAKKNANVTGTSCIASQKRPETERVHSTIEFKAKNKPCWAFAKGKCTTGEDCRFSHGNANSQASGSSTNSNSSGGNGANTGRKCEKCSDVIKGPKHWKKCSKCFKKEKQDQNKGGHSANVASEGIRGGR